MQSLVTCEHISCGSHVTLFTQYDWMSIICRSPAHCIEYAHLIQWGRDRPDEEFDADVEEHMKWMYKHALARAQEFGIQASPAWPSALAIMPCASAACCHPTCAVTGMCTLLLCCSCMSMIHLELAQMTARSCADEQNHTCVLITLWCLVSCINMTTWTFMSSIRHRLTQSNLSAVQELYISTAPMFSPSKAL